MSNLIVDPEYDKILKEINNLKEDMTRLYQEKDELTYHTNKNIETVYMNKIGILEYKVYQYQCKVLRLKRKIELIQIRLNRQEKVNYDEIELELDAEYREYEEKLKNMSENIQNLLERKNAEKLSDLEAKELKQIYRKLVKKLHPDLSNSNEEKNIQLLHQVIEAYKNADLVTMRNLELLIEEINNVEIIAMGTFEELQKLKLKYELIIKGLLENIKNIENSFPYNQQEFLKNDVLVEERKIELNAILEMYKKVYKELEDRFNNMKGI